MSRRFAAWLALAANGTVRAAALSAQDPTTDSLPKASVDSTADSLTAPQRYKNKIFGLPFVGYSPTTKFIFGAGGQIQFKTGESAYDSTTRASNISAGFSITTAGQWGVSFSNDFFTLHNRWWFNSRILTGYAPTDYYGIGPSTDPSDTNRMEQKVVHFEAKALRRVSSTLYLGPYYRLHAAWAVDFRFPALIPSSLHGGDGSTSSGLGFSARSPTLEIRSSRRPLGISLWWTCSRTCNSWAASTTTHTCCSTLDSTSPSIARGITCSH